MALDQQRRFLRRSWAVKLEGGWQTFRPLRTDNDRVIAVTHVSLVDPASAGGQGAVRACVKIGTRRHCLASLSAESPRTDLRPHPFQLDQNEEFTLYTCAPRGGGTPDGAAVQFEGYKCHREEFGEEETEEEDEVALDYEDDVEYDTDDEDDVEYDTDDDEVDGQAPMASSAGDDSMLQRRNFAPGGQFVGGGFASAGRTAGFMRVAAVESQEEGDSCNKQISVLCCRTNFSTPSDGGLQVRQGTTVFQLRFVVPRACDTARSLQWVGMSLSELVYPWRSYKRLRRLWSSLVGKVSIPTRTTHVEVLFHFGIFLEADRTSTKRMERMEAMAGRNFYPDVHWELHLPEPEPGQCHAGEDCAVCSELLGSDDLAAWPGCSEPHAFHGACLELVLKKSDMCPICGNFWYIEPKRLNELDGEVW